jgi:hypothetical protein
MPRVRLRSIVAAFATGDSLEDSFMSLRKAKDWEKYFKKNV